MQHDCKWDGLGLHSVEAKWCHFKDQDFSGREGQKSDNGRI